MADTQMVFMDTEFTSFASPELVSIGLAASTSEEFYAEVPFPAAAASPFVHEVVMPLLGSDPQAYCPAGLLHVPDPGLACGRQDRPRSRAVFRFGL